MSCSCQESMGGGGGAGLEHGIPPHHNYNSVHYPVYSPEKYGSGEKSRHSSSASSDSNYDNYARLAAKYIHKNDCNGKQKKLDRDISPEEEQALTRHLSYRRRSKTNEHKDGSGRSGKAGEGDAACDAIPESLSEPDDLNKKSMTAKKLPRPSSKGKVLMGLEWDREGGLKVWIENVLIPKKISRKLIVFELELMEFMEIRDSAKLKLSDYETVDLAKKFQLAEQHQNTLTDVSVTIRVSKLVEGEEDGDGVGWTLGCVRLSSDAVSPAARAHFTQAISAQGFPALMWHPLS